MRSAAGDTRAPRTVLPDKLFEGHDLKETSQQYRTASGEMARTNSMPLETMQLTRVLVTVAV